MTHELLQDWQMLYANAVSEGESGQVGIALEQAETAIKRRFEEESDTLSALEESEIVLGAPDSTASEGAGCDLALSNKFRLFTRLFRYPRAYFV
jgi:hypothetical protein